MRFVQYVTRLFSRYDAVVNVALDWSRALDAAGHEVVLAHGNTDVWYPEAGPRTTVQYIPHAGYGTALLPVGLARHLQPNDVVILHTDFHPANLTVAAELRARRIPYIVVPHGAYYAEQLAFVDRWARPRLWAEQRMLRHCLAIHVFWESEAARIRPFSGPVSFVTAPTGTHAAAERWTGGGGYGSWLGRYVISHKGLDVLARALARLPVDVRPRLRLHGADHRGELGQLRSLVDELDIGPWFATHGPIAGAAKESFLREADFYVHPSRWECHSVALIENLALGVPSIVSRGNNCAPELEASGAALVADPSPESFAKGLLEMVELTDAERGAMSGRAVAFASKQLDWVASANSFVTQVQALLDRRTR